MPTQLMFRDHSIASLTGSDQLAIDLNGNRQGLYIQNTGTATLYVNFSGPAKGGTGPSGKGNTAASGTTGTVPLVAGASFLFNILAPQNPVVVQGTAGQPVVILEG